MDMYTTNRHDIIPHIDAYVFSQLILSALFRARAIMYCQFSL